MKKALFVVETTQSILDLRNDLRHKFEQSPEGMETRQLGIILSHVNKLENFEHFFSEHSGPDGLGQHLTYLKQNHIKADKGILKMMEIISEKMQNGKLPNWEKINHFVKLKQELKKRLRLKRDVHEFVRELDSALMMLYPEKYPNVPIVKELREHSKKTKMIRKIWHYEAVVSAWKILFKRFYMPFDPKQYNLSAFAHSIDENVCIRAIAHGLHMQEDEIREELRKLFPSANFENNNLENVQSFVKSAKKNSLVKILNEFGKEKNAKAFVNLFSHGAARPDVAIQIYNKWLSPLISEEKKKNIELEAVKEFYSLMNETIDSFEKPVYDLSKKLQSKISRRIKTVKIRRAKDLSKTEEFTDELINNDKKLLTSITAGTNCVNEIQKNNVKKSEASSRLILSTMIINANAALSEYEIKNNQENKLDVNELNVKLHKLIKEAKDHEPMAISTYFERTVHYMHSLTMQGKSNERNDFVAKMTKDDTPTKVIQSVNKEIKKKESILESVAEMLNRLTKQGNGIALKSDKLKEEIVKNKDRGTRPHA